MALTKQSVEKEIQTKIEDAKKTGKRMPRKQAIGELIRDATRGMKEAEQQVSLLQTELKAINAEIATQGRYASLEQRRILILRQIAEEDEKERGGQ